MKRSGSFKNITIGGKSWNKTKIAFDQLLTSIHEIQEKVHVSGDVYAVTAGNDENPYILFERENGAGLFNPEITFNLVDRFWFILHQPHSRAYNMEWANCGYCSSEGDCYRFNAGKENPLRAPLKKDDDGFETALFTEGTQPMCTSCLSELTGILDNCEGSIWKHLTIIRL